MVRIPDTRQAQFNSPPLDVGEYKLVFCVTDNGNPPKQVEKEIVLKVNKKLNNQPKLASNSRRVEAVAGEPIKINIVAEDRDDDPVTFELLDNEFEGAILIQAEGKNEAEFVCEPLESGDYSFDVKLDDGKEPKLKDGEPVPNIVNVRLEVIPPSFLDAQQTKISSIVRNKKGQVVAWIDVRPTGEHHQVQPGDSFMLDRLTWTVRSVSIESQEVVFEVAGVLKSFKFRDFLSKPRSETPVADQPEEGPDDSSTLTTAEIGDSDESGN